MPRDGWAKAEKMERRVRVLERERKQLGALIAKQEDELIRLRAEVSVLRGFREGVLAARKTTSAPGAEREG